MHIEKISLSNFKCFGEDETSIFLEEDVTCFVGNNGSGKTALIIALKRLFGSTTEERNIMRDDFYISSKETIREINGRKLYIDVTFAFPEIEDSIICKKTCPAFETVFFADEKDKKLKVRIRLESEWNETEYEDEVESKVYYIRTSKHVDFGKSEEDTKQLVSIHERKNITLKYIPAFRDSNAILKKEVKLFIKFLDDYILIDKDTQCKIEKAGESLNNEVEWLEPIKAITAILTETWKKTHDDTLKHYQILKLEASSSNIKEILRSISIKLGLSESGIHRDIGDLSDGQISLLYFTLSIAIYQIKELHQTEEIPGFKKLDKKMPVFTIFAFEEPENHISPYYLGRVLNLLSEITNGHKATGIVTSHSASVVRRMNRVEQIRYFRQDDNITGRYSVVKKILLPPNKSSKDYKYINQAVLAHPELYFAKAVVLGEGDSEEIVIPYIAKKLDLDLDPSFVAFVKLGGRHVNHMWKLLNDLTIPHVTLLDLDLGRSTGGLQTIIRIIKKLHNHGYQNDEGLANILDETESLDKLLKSTDTTTPTANEVTLDRVLTKLHKYKIFFSYPLDLDMSMIQAFPASYELQVSNTAAITSEELKSLLTVVLRKEGDEEIYTKLNIPLSNEQLINYKKLFESNSKVASHYLAMAKITAADIKKDCPASIRKLIEKSSELLQGKVENE